MIIVVILTNIGARRVPYLKFDLKKRHVYPLLIGMVSLKDERIVYSRVIEYIPTYLGHVVKSRQL